MKQEKSPLEAVQGRLVWVYDCSLGNSSNGGLSSYCQTLEIGKDIELVESCLTQFCSNMKRHILCLETKS